MSDSIEFNISLNEPVDFNLEVGNQGPKGDKGDTGSKGDTGDRGEKGAPGTTDYNQLQNKPQLDLYLKKSEANTTTADLLNKISQNTDSINDTKNSLRNYAFISDVNNRISEAKSELNGNINQSETRINNTIGQAKTELNGKITEADNKTSSLDTKFTKLTSDNKAEITQIKANLTTTNSVLSTHKELVDKRFTDVNTEQTSQNSLISDILNAFSKESEKGTNLKLNSSATKVLGMTIYGNTEQVNTSGKNLLKITARTATSQGISSTVSDDGTVAYSGTITNSWANITDYTVFPTPLPAGKYAFSIDYPRTHRVVFKYKLADGTISDVIANMTTTSTSNTFTTTQPIVAGYLFISAANGSNLKDTVKAQLETGDTATDYELYTNGLPTPRTDFSQVIKNIKSSNLSVYSRNLFNTIFGNRILNNVEVKTHEDGSFSLNGIASIGSSLITPTYTKSFIPAGKYKLVVEHLGGTAEKNFAGANFIVSIPIQKGSVVYSSYLRPEDLNGRTKIFDVNITDVLDEKYTPFVWIPHNETTNQGFWNYKNLRLRITLVKDGEDTEFTPFDINTTSIMLPELNKIGNYQDCVYFKDGKWYLEKNTDTKTFDGSESWAKTSEDNVNIYYLVNSINSVSDYADGLSPHFKNAKAYPNKAGTFAIRGGGKSVFFNHGTISTINEWKTWLNSNNVTVVFPTLPVTTEITDLTTLTRLNMLMETRTYDGTTNILITGTDLTPEIKVKYMKKIN
jgi:hyaluronoglucosaminidase|nr:MAG TPA: collagen alpha 1(VIII) chain protein [Caudoviricetes sp.]